MKLYIQSPAPNFDRSQEFYKSIGFNVQLISDQKAIVSDDRISLIINGLPNARLGIILASDNVQVYFNRYNEKYSVLKDEKGYITADPNGVKLYLQPMYQKQIPKKSSSSIIGTNYGYGIETHYMEQSIDFWHRLGYTSPTTAVKSYVTLSANNLPDLTLFAPGMCPHAFYNPSLTYFNGKEGNPKVINQIRQRGIVPVEEITAFNPEGLVDNIIISDPGGLHYFIFND